MPTTTPNMGLTKDAESEYYSVTRVNDNIDKIDTYCGENRSRIAALEASELTMQKIYDALPTDLEPTQAEPADLDTLLTAGVYLVADTTAAGYVTHSPVTDGGYYIRVLYLGMVDTTIMRQEIIPLAKPWALYARHYDSVSGWTAWSSQDSVYGALASLINTGAKNRLQQSDFTTTGSSIDIPCILPAGEYVLYRGNLQSTDTDASTCLFRLYDDSGGSNVQRLNQTIVRGSGLTYRFTITDKATFARFYPSDTAAHSSGDTLTAQNMMICPAAMYDVSPAFVEYCPTLAELYAIVQGT